jgi:HNH endonuclease/Homing endonuclease associated repeat
LSVIKRLSLKSEFRFDLHAKKTRVSDDDLLAALQSAAERFGEGYFTSPSYDSQPGAKPHSSTIIERFGSWKKALALIGINGGRERRYTADQLIANLESVWQELGFPPGKRQIASFGGKISESPYKRRWGSLHHACVALAAFHDGKLSREQLLAGSTVEPVRSTIPLKDRWAVLKRDNYRCSKCGASPSSDHSVELEVDHINPVAKGGTNDLVNLQTLCWSCNQGKKDRL